MKPQILLLCLAALGLLAPSVRASQDTDLVSIQMDADEVLLLERESYTSSDASDLRQTIDSDHGNDDGTVTTDEITKYNNDHWVHLTEDKPDCFSNFQLARLDGTTPLRVSDVRENISSGGTGPISSTIPIGVSHEILFRYPKPRSGEPSAEIRLSDAEGQATGMAIACYVGGMGNWGSWNPYCCSPPPTQTYMSDSEAQSGGTSGAPAFTIHPFHTGVTFDKASLRPTSLLAYWDGQGLAARTDPARQSLQANTVSVIVKDPAAGPPKAAAWQGTAKDVGAYVGYATLGVGAVGLGLALSMEYFRYQVLKWLLLIPGFSRLEKDEVLEHTKRDELYRFIKTNPGPSFSDLRRGLELSNGTLVHHLRILEMQEYIKPVRDGFRTRFYVRGPKIVPTSYLTRTQQQLLDAIGANPGLTQKELSQVLGLPRESVSYHTRRLAAVGKLEIKQEGKWRRYFPPLATVPGASSTPKPGLP